MAKLSSKTVKLIDRSVDYLFETVKAHALGPKAVGKRFYIGHSDFLSLPGVFEHAARLEGIAPDKETMDNLIAIASNFLEAAKFRAKARIIAKLEAKINDTKIKETSQEFISELDKELSIIWASITSEVNRIIESEVQKFKSSSLIEGIVQMNASVGEQDPTVFFVVVRDNVLCEECRRLHLLPNGIIPRVYKLSQLSHQYHEKGTDTPSIMGEHPHCLTADMRLHTDYGMLTVEELFKINKPLLVPVDARIKNRRIGNNQFGDIIPGNTYIDRHGSGSNIYTATNVYDTGIQDCYEIELTSGHIIKVSDEHEMWIDNNSSGIKIKAKNLKIGDKIPLFSGEGMFGKEDFADIAELMGNLMGDGTINKKVAQWNFFGNDIIYGEKLKIKASKFTNINYSLTIKQPDNKYRVERATFRSTILKNIFVDQFNLNKKPRRVPNRIWQANKATVSAFLRGLYAADGHSEKSCAVVLAQNDKKFLQEIQQLLSNFGLISKIYKHGDTTIKNITYADGSTFKTTRKPCWRLHIGGWDQANKFAKEIGFGVPAKQEKLLHILEQNKHKIRHGSWRVARVANIKYIGKQQTYCLTEPITNTITVNGIVTGNCRCTISTLLIGWGFNEAGMVTWRGENWDEYAFQNQIQNLTSP